MAAACLAAPVGCLLLENIDRKTRRSAERLNSARLDMMDVIITQSFL